MQEPRQARKLAETLVRVGTRAGKKVVALLTDMNAPLGRTIGNALEAREALELLAGQSAPDLLECTLALGCEMLLLGRVCKTKREANARLLAAIRDGSALAAMERIVAAQGGDPRVVRDPSRLARAPLQVDVPALRGGFVSEIDARELGLTGVMIGGGRLRADDPVDPAVGIEILTRRGDAVRAGAPVARLHLRAPSREAEARVSGAFRISAARPRARPLIISRVTARGR
jgi:thymidine phosphorylase